MCSRCSRVVCLIIMKYAICHGEGPVGHFGRDTSFAGTAEQNRDSSHPWGLQPGTLWGTGRREGAIGGGLLFIVIIFSDCPKFLDLVKLYTTFWLTSSGSKGSYRDYVIAHVVAPRLTLMSSDQ